MLKSDKSTILILRVLLTMLMGTLLSKIVPIEGRLFVTSLTKSNHFILIFSISNLVSDTSSLFSASDSGSSLR